MGDDVMTSWRHGNAVADSKDTRGWILGHFIDPIEGGVRSTKDLEVEVGRSSYRRQAS